MKTCEELGRYINKNMKFPSDLSCLYMKLENPKIDEPKEISKKTPIVNLNVFSGQNMSKDI